MNGCGGGAASAANLPTQSPPSQQPATTPQEPRRGKGAERRTYKSCDFCAKRKRKCDGKLPRCSLCVEKNQAYCHYQLKPPTKPRAGTPGAAGQRHSTTSSATLSSTSSGGVGAGVGGGKRLAGPPPVSCGGNALAVAVPGTRFVARQPGLMSLKRSRLSASPATGLVGMQENVFLGDFFECLGILPLATERIVREAMVEIMMGTMAPRQQQQQRFSLDDHELKRDHRHRIGNVGGGRALQAYSVARGEAGLVLGFGGRDCEDEDMEMEMETAVSGGLVGRATTETPTRCIMWCAIALGALVKGAPIENVIGYMSLAREALATCFDGGSIENVRAFLMMSFLHGLIHDEEKHKKYFSFAMSIMSKLRPGDVPKDLAAMVLTTEKMSIFSRAENTQIDDIGAYLNKSVDFPPVGDVVHQKDLCNLFLAADRRLSQAFITDMMSQGEIAADDDAKEPGGRREAAMGGFLSQRENDGLPGDQDVCARVEEIEGAPLRSCDDPRASGGGHNQYPCAGPAVTGYIEETLPELSRLSNALGRSDSIAGIGGVFYHGNLAYMKAVNGDMASSFESLRACADVVKRYPGIVRFRPHLFHCILAGSHAMDRGMSMEREVHIIHNTDPRVQPTDQGMVGGLPSSSLDDVVSSRTELQAGSRNGVQNIASGPVLAEPVLAGSILAEADVLFSAEPPHLQQTIAQQSDNSTTVSGGGAASDGYRYNLADPVATNRLASVPGYRAVAAAGVGWPGLTTGQEREREPITHGGAIPAGGPAPQLASASIGMEPGAGQENTSMTEADLLDISAVLMSED